MATIEHLSTALKNAHAAGDTAAAQKLASAIRQMQGRSQAGAASQPGAPWERYRRAAQTPPVGPWTKYGKTGLAGAVGATATVAPGTGESFSRGALDMASFGFDDEIGSGIRTGFGLLGDYGAAVEESRGVKQMAQEANPGSFMAGQIAGAIPMAFVPGLNIARGATLAGKVGHSAMVGGGLGSVYGLGSGEGGFGERVPSAIEGMAFGGGAGGVVPLAGRAIGAGARAVMGRGASNRAATVAGPGAHR